MVETELADWTGRLTDSQNQKNLINCYQFQVQIQDSFVGTLTQTYPTVRGNVQSEEIWRRDLEGLDYREGHYIFLNKLFNLNTQVRWYQISYRQGFLNGIFLGGGAGSPATPPIFTIFPPIFSWNSPIFPIFSYFAKKLFFHTFLAIWSVKYQIFWLFMPFCFIFIFFIGLLNTHIWYSVKEG